MNATIKDVARLSGVSIATVSKYINGGNLKEANRINIENAISTLDYKVNTLARGLKTSKSMTIGIMVDHITNVFYTSIISIVEDYLHNKGYSSIICETKGNYDIACRKTDFLISKGVDGIVLFTTSANSEYLNYYLQKEVKIVVVDSISYGVGCDFVTTDNISGAYQAVEQFIIKGHKKIALITGLDDDFSAIERYRGYTRALEDYNVPLNTGYIFKDSYDLEGGYKSMKKLISLKNDAPTAVLIANYYMTIGSVIAINEENISIPEDLSVICFDDLELSKVFKPKLTSVAQSVEKIGKATVEVLMKRIEQNDTNSGIIRIPPRLIINDSVKII
jgi:LacI family transcriptional regulator